MKIYAIGDLHLDLSRQKPMDVFGEAWYAHEEKIKTFWEDTIDATDIVLLVGDLSWAMKFNEAKVDLDFIAQLPGKKILIKGNHDYWWQSLRKMQDSYPAFHFIQNNSFTFNHVGICGTRGWDCPGSEFYKEEDEKIYQRELNRLELSLKSIPSGVYHTIVAMHYPPTNEIKALSGFTQLFEKYAVKQVVYGHLHGADHFDHSIKEMHNHINYNLVSADFLSFKPKLIYQD